MQYVRNWSFGMDMKILGMTATSVLHHTGVQSGDEQTTIDFDLYRRQQMEKEK